MSEATFDSKNIFEKQRKQQQEDQPTAAAGQTLIRVSISRKVAKSNVRRNKRPIGIKK